jgi:hypothetical protein
MATARTDTQYRERLSPHATESNPALKMRSKIDNEVRPSTVKTWLTIWRSSSTQPTDHWLRAVAENRMRTPYATIILARMKKSKLHSTRPRREMQSYPRLQSSRSRLTSGRGPPAKNWMILTPQLLTGNSVELVRVVTTGKRGFRFRSISITRMILAGRRSGRREAVIFFTGLSHAQR